VRRTCPRTFSWCLFFTGFPADGTISASLTYSLPGRAQLHLFVWSWPTLFHVRRRGTRALCEVWIWMKPSVTAPFCPQSGQKGGPPRYRQEAVVRKADRCLVGPPSSLSSGQADLNGAKARATQVFRCTPKKRHPLNGPRSSEDRPSAASPSGGLRSHVNCQRNCVKRGA
jgi:hypothetical protein